MLACPECHRHTTWSTTSKARSRQNSVIHWLQCTNCHQGIVAKLPLLPGSSLGDARRAELEYQTLLQLQALFPQSDGYGTLCPVACLDESGILVTRRFGGHNLTRRLRQSHQSLVPECCRQAGIWLRMLHDACPRGYDKQPLGVDDRVIYLQSTYGSPLSREPVARTAYETLIEAGNALKGSIFRATWGHGDFKPENLLFDGRKYVGIDTLLECRSAVMYDLASFLNHLLLAGRTMRHRYLRKSVGQIEEQFFSGYGNLDREDLHAIRWLQLYFMLCYWARSQGRDRLRAMYGSWQILPLLREAEAGLRHGAP